MLAAVLAVAACAGGAGETLEQVASWGSTARMAAESRAGGATTARYTSVVLHATHAELAAATRSLDQSLASGDGAPAMTPEQRRRALLAARDVERTVDAMAQRADRAPDDTAALRRLGIRADSDGRLAKALSDSVGGR